MLGEQSVLGYANDDGEANLKVLVPKKSGTSKVRIANAGGTFDTAEINALGAAKLQIGLKRQRIAGGEKQTVTVRGLAPAESASISIAWPGGQSGKGVGGQANNKGVFKATIKVPNKPGTAKVKAAGQFKNRKGSTLVHRHPLTVRSQSRNLARLAAAAVLAAAAGARPARRLPHPPRPARATTGSPSSWTSTSSVAACRPRASPTAAETPRRSCSRRPVSR